jgi:hypothetical protein
MGGITFNDLWLSAPRAKEYFDPAQTSGLPGAPQRYLKHAIAAGTPLASTVRLRMHGEIKLKGWNHFSADEVIRWDRGMIWHATVRMHGLPIHGGDSFVDGRGAMKWKLFGIVPFINASGADITRSAAGRVNIESIWLPSVLCGDSVSWTGSSLCHAHAQFDAHGETAQIDYTVDEKGGLKTVNMPRWGNPGGGEFRYASCGGFVDEENTFDGFTIPTRMRIGWHFGTETFESEGEFFRVVIDDAVYK